MNSRALRSPGTTSRRNFVRRSTPWIAFAALLLWGWRVWNPLHWLPAYDDVLELLWVVRWWAGGFRAFGTPWVYPLTFFPEGWRVATYANGPAVLLPLLPLNALFGAAGAYNLAVLFTFPVAFLGMQRLATRFLSPLPAAIAALLFTFWGFRWFRIAGHLDILLASALLPWVAWSLEGWLRRQPRKAAWLIATGVLWAITIMASLYFVWLGGLLIGAWIVGWLIGRRIRAREALMAVVVTSIVALALNLPWLVIFLRESAAAHTPFFDIAHVSSWDASLNSLPIPSIYHPWSPLQSLARSIYRGPVNEPGQANLGLLTCLLALVGLVPAWRDRKWWPVLLCVTAGLVLALGLTLKWNGEMIQVPALRPLNGLLWRLGFALKPGFFVESTPPAPFDAAVPLPGILLSALVPFWERARVLSRYALVGGVGVFLLAGLGLMQVRKTWLQLSLAALLVVELLIPPLGRVPYPPPSHPAFAWLQRQAIAPAGMIDLGSWQQDKLYIMIGGDSLWATDYHGQPTVAGASSVWPAHVVFLDQWLQDNPHPYLRPDLATLLRGFNVQRIVFHLNSGYAEEMLEEAKQNPDLSNMNCFEPESRSGPWPYPICIFQVTPAGAGSDIVYRNGWSDAEEWGRWVEGTESQASWVSIGNIPYRLSIDVFPQCIPEKPQALRVEVNGAPVAEHRWQDCSNWASDITIPAAVVKVGWNEIVLHSDHADRPVDVTDGKNPDTRALSIGVNKLLVQPSK